MSFTLKIKDKVEEREINGDLTIKDLLDDLDLSSETMVSKKNGDFLLFFILIFLLFFVLLPLFFNNFNNLN